MPIIVYITQRHTLARSMPIIVYITDRVILAITVPNFVNITVANIFFISLGVQPSLLIPARPVRTKTVRQGCTILSACYIIV
jgi:hypothetical protein|tara:strand:- start:2264 stop:2509 length:246 start_codon:yes stop_codon:yes gene_type:complete